MHQHIGQRPIQAGTCSNIRLDKLLDCLQLAEVVAAADRAERPTETALTQNLPPSAPTPHRHPKAH
jgi:hypothetical protein